MNTACIDIGGTTVKYALFDDKAQILNRGEIPYDNRLGGDFVIETIKKILSSFSGFDRIGISATGQVNSKEGKIIGGTSSIPGYVGLPIRDILEREFPVPIAVENDVNAAALGEAHFGAGIGQPNFLCLTYGTGVGGAIILNGNIFSGALGIAAEYGHMITHKDGDICPCSQRGCYEAYASATALIRSAMKISRVYQDGRIIFSHFKEDLLLLECVNRWIDEIVTGLVNLNYIFNPSLIVLGGGVMEQAYVLEEVKRRLPKRVMPNYRQVKIHAARLGNLAGVYGAYYSVNQI